MKIFITGGTGSLGSRIVDFIWRNSSRKHQFIIFSRDEQKHYQMRLKYENTLDRVHFVIGDVRDPESISGAIEVYKPDVVIHTAAQKHVMICDLNPMQAVLTNIHGTKNVVRACIDNNVKIACFVSTDKAVLPTTLYGMTKHIGERIWMNASKQKTSTKFVGVRYGNVANSTGSLIPLYLDLAKNCNPVFPLTSTEMTRFFITFDQAISLIVYTLKKNKVDLKCQIIPPEIYCIDQEIFFIPKLPAAYIKDIADIFAEAVHGTVDIIGEYQSEKFNEAMTISYTSADDCISKEEIREILLKEGLLPCE